MRITLSSKARVLTPRVSDVYKRQGDTQIVSDLLMEEMQALAAEMKFEEAQKIKEKWARLRPIHGGQ